MRAVSATLRSISKGTVRKSRKLENVEKVTAQLTACDWIESLFEAAPSRSRLEPFIFAKKLKNAYYGSNYYYS